MCATIMFKFFLFLSRNLRRQLSKNTESGPPDTPIINVSSPFKNPFKSSRTFSSAFLW